MPPTTAFAEQERNQTLEEGLIVHCEFCILNCFHSPLHSSQRLSEAPATGYRNCATGALTEVGTGGFYFASSPYAADDYGASYLGFNSNEINPIWTNTRARSFALSVRCVQASAGRFS